MPELWLSSPHFELVTQWQHQLNAVMDAQLKGDGFFGPLTEHATRAFQKAMSLPETGIVDDQTAHVMEENIRLGIHVTLPADHPVTAPVPHGGDPSFYVVPNPFVLGSGTPAHPAYYWAEGSHLDSVTAVWADSVSVPFVLHNEREMELHIPVISPDSKQSEIHISMDFKTADGHVRKTEVLPCVAPTWITAVRETSIPAAGGKLHIEGSGLDHVTTVTVGAEADWPQARIVEQHPNLLVVETGSVAHYLDRWVFVLAHIAHSENSIGNPHGGIKVTH